MQNVKTITIYAASSSQISPIYFQAARDLGILLSSRRITCVNGGGCNGLMAAVTDVMLENNGNVCGVIPRFMIDKGWLHPAITEVIVTEDMHARKQMMAQKSDACIALPGGVGTLEELLEIITWKQLGLYTKPVIILNTNGFYNDLLSLLEKAEREHFLHHNQPNIWQVAATPEESINLIFEQENP
jgi:uncharacterized protein (TIGR00730 family)